MKTIKKLLALGMLTIFMGCGQSKNMTSSSTNPNTSRSDADYTSTAGTNRNSQTMTRNDQNINRDNQDTNRNAQNTDRNSKDANRTNRDTNQNEQNSARPMDDRTGNEAEQMNNSDWDNSNPEMVKRRKQMYSDLGMTQDQINRYESEYQSSMEKWNKDNGSRMMSNSERTKHDDRMLNSILKPSQYTQYQTWIKNNPYEH